MEDEDGEGVAEEASEAMAAGVGGEHGAPASLAAEACGGRHGHGRPGTERAAVEATGCARTCSMAERD